MHLARKHLLTVYRKALEAVQGEARTRQVLSEMSLANTPQSGPLVIIAIGKAAESMMQGALSVFGEQLEAGLIITKQSDSAVNSFLHEKIHLMKSGHPLPDEQSLLAGQYLLSFLEKQSDQARLVFLISGGASSLVEVLPEGMSLTDLQQVNHWLLSNAWDIASMNRVRKHFSCIKGGRLARCLGKRKATCLMISDVPDDRPNVIGSGFLFPDENRYQHGIADIPGLPQWIAQLPAAPSPPAKNDRCFDLVTARIIATLNDAKQAAVTAAQELGYTVVLHEQMVTGDAALTGRELAQQFCDGEPAFHIWGGETTVSLPARPGRGGRNQHMALAAAGVLAKHQQCYFLAAGTDGSDGPTNDAGAVVDANTLERGRKCGFDWRRSLDEADAGSFLAASDDLIRTGPTGTNVMDLIFGLKFPSSS